MADAKTTIFTSATCLLHDPGPSHPECPDRLRIIESAIRQDKSLAQQINWRTADGINDGMLLRAHTPAYLAELVATIGQFGSFDNDTTFGPYSYQAARSAAAVAVAAALAVYASETRSAFCLARPPGHHATAAQAMGFCLLNHVAIAAKHLQSLGCDRILIVDWDVHHGNGTQEIFYGDPSVFYYSAHLFPHYPGTGTPDERGRGEGEGTTKNRCLPSSCRRETYLELFRSDLEEIAASFSPQLILISCGFDAHHDDPLGGLHLISDDFETLTTIVFDVIPGKGLVSILEGGYNLKILGSAAVAHLRGLVHAD